MTATERLIPPAAALMESLRGIGYSLRTAVADILDNSVAAGAQNVWVRFHWAGSRSTLAILDDGAGMSEEELALAMTTGSRHPSAVRKNTDLGRFGLGLKTASFSQCRRLLVATRRDGGSIAVRVWDLDHVATTNDWLVFTEPADEEVPFVEQLASRQNGTLVLWSRLDRLAGDVAEDDADARLAFLRASEDVRQHLAMTFHRFLEGTRPALRIYLNGDSDEFRVMAWDPFVSSHPSTQLLAEVRRTIPGGAVVLQGYVLPHRDRLSAAEYDRAAGRGGWVAHQGFNVYRGERLLVAGGWLGLGSSGNRAWTQEEQFKLARIRLDIPNTMDAEWRIDVKKSVARPPRALRSWLQRNAERVRGEAREVFVHRGGRSPGAVGAAQHDRAWQPTGGATPTYRISREHPVVRDVLASAGSQRPRIEQMLKILEATVPVHRIWLDVAEKPEAPPPVRAQVSESEIESLARDLFRAFTEAEGLDRASAFERLRRIEPFEHFPHVLAAISE